MADVQWGRWLMKMLNLTKMIQHVQSWKKKWSEGIWDKKARGNKHWREKRKRRRILRMSLITERRRQVNGQWVVMAERWIGESERASPSHSTGHRFAKQLEMEKERRWIFEEKKENGRNLFALCINGSDRDFWGLEKESRPDWFVKKIEVVKAQDLSSMDCVTGSFQQKERGRGEPFWKWNSEIGIVKVK